MSTFLPLSKKSFLARFIAWFFFINTLICFSIEISYVIYMPQLHSVLGATNLSIGLAWGFLIASYIAHSTLLNFFLALICVFVMTALPRKRLVVPTAIVLASVMVMAFLIDRVAYGLFHMHNLSQVWIIVSSGSLREVLPLSFAEMALMLAVWAVVVLTEVLIAALVMYYVKHQRTRHGTKFATLLLGSVLFSYGMMAFAITVAKPFRFDEPMAHLLLRTARFVPYYTTLYKTLVPHDNNYQRVIPSQEGAVSLMVNMADKPLKYPTEPLRFATSEKAHPNILFIVIDTLRYDAVNPIATPAIYQFGQKNMVFTHHMSGGNCTQPGVFSLLYGLPANYWEAMRDQQRGPVLIDQLLKDDYQFGVYASAPLVFPQFNRTVFVNVPNLTLRTEGETSIDRDATITNKFLSFLQTRDQKKPFFGFLFYDTVHNYCQGGAKANSAPFQPAVTDCERYSLDDDSNPTPYFNRYQNAAHYVDSQVSRVLERLQQEHLLDNTIVIITSDHGTEFNDNHLGYWSHGSAYTQVQLHTPFIMHMPDRKHEVINYNTTHMDVAPTLMHSALQCESPFFDYSVGGSLFTPHHRDFLISGSYNDYAVVTPQWVTRIYPNGDYVTHTPNGQTMKVSNLDKDVMNEAYAELNHYFH